MKVTLDDILGEWQKWLTNCDLDELIAVTEETFAVDIKMIITEEGDVWDDVFYDVQPANENYCGAFDDDWAG